MARTYPVERPPEGESDGRFTFGLALKVGTILWEHGYPKVEDGQDFVQLQRALFRFIYGETKL